MIYNITGQIYHITDVVEFGKRNPKKKVSTTITITNPLTEDKIEYVSFDFIEDNIKLLKGFAVGMNIEVRFILAGRVFIPEKNPNSIINYENKIAIGIIKV